MYWYDKAFIKLYTLFIQIAKAVISSSNALPIPQYIDVYVAVGQLVGDNDIGVANKAILITSNLPEEAYTKVLEEMKILLKCSSSSKCNVFEVNHVF